MKSLIDQLSTYASYHRDRRNIATHFVGIPMILFAITAFMSRPVFAVGGVPFALSPAFIAMVLVAIYYFALDVRYGIAMALVLAANIWGAAQLAAQSTAVWAATAGGLFVVGWIFQLVGHAFEGKKPAFLDDLAGLLIGPLFVVAEAGFMIGLGASVNEKIIERAGPTRAGALAKPVA